jgi:hypothetical protein
MHISRKETGDGSGRKSTGSGTQPKITCSKKNMPIKDCHPFGLLVTRAAPTSAGAPKLSGATKMAGAPNSAGAPGGSFLPLSISLTGRRPASGVDVETGFGLFTASPIVAG